ncbi:MAG: hypothetical protein U0232_09720 [Thermomicrobiales bacterium]
MGAAQDYAGDAVAEGVAAVRAGGAEFDGPEVAGETGGEVDFGDRAVRARGEQGGVEGAAGVDDEEVAGAEVVGEVAEAGVGDGVVGAVRDEQADFVAGEAARFGGLVGFEVGREGEVEGGEREMGVFG